MLVVVIELDIALLILSQAVWLHEILIFQREYFWSSASSDVLYSVPTRSSIFSVSYMSCVSWPTICSNKEFWRASSVTPDARMKY